MATRSERSSTENRLLIRESVAEDLPHIADNLAHEDIAELVAATGLQPRDAMAWCHARSDETWVATIDGKPISIGGVRKDEDDDTEIPSANVWSISLPVAAETPRPLMRLLRKKTRELEKRYGILWCYVDDRNEVRKRWVSMIGYHESSEIEKAPHVPLPFRLFTSQPLVK